MHTRMATIADTSTTAASKSQRGCCEPDHAHPNKAAAGNLRPMFQKRRCRVNLEGTKTTSGQKCTLSHLRDPNLTPFNHSFRFQHSFAWAMV